MLGVLSCTVVTSAADDASVSQLVFTITEKAFSWLKVPTSAFTFKTLLKSKGTGGLDSIVSYSSPYDNCDGDGKTDGSFYSTN